MKFASKIFFYIIISFTLLFGQNSLIPPSSVAVTDNALSIYSNPAALGYRNEMELYALFPYENQERTNYFSGTLLSGSMAFNGSYYNDYQQWQVGSGTTIWNSVNLGSTLRWFGTLNYKPEYDIGLMARPAEYISLGTSIKNVSGRNSRSETISGAVAIKPLSGKLTLSAGMYRDINQESKIKPKFYGEVEPVQGVELSASYSNNKNLKVGLNINLSNIGFSIFSVDNRSSDFTDGAMGIHISPNNYSSVLQKDKQNIATIELNKEIKEQSKLLEKQPFSSIKGIIQNINTLKESEDIDGILIKFNGELSAGWAKKLEIRNALMRFKESGKNVYWYANSLTDGQYFLASVADKIYFNPAGTAWVTGLSSSSIYFRETLDSIGIEPEFKYIGKYKSAREPFSRQNRSEADREQQTKLLNDLYSLYIDKVTRSRKMTVDSLQQIIKQGPYEAPRAKNSGLIDSLIYKDEIKGALEETLKKQVKLTSGKNYITTPPYKDTWKYKSTSSKIALVYATGGITMGKSHRSLDEVKNIGSETLSKAIKKAREDQSVKAIVLRVDSPGGSALASEIISREVKKSVRGKDKKPFIVSMSDVAASGGYHISSLADTIVASPTTITGSIGVLGGKFNLEGFMSKIGMNSSTIKTNSSADMMTPFREWSSEEEEKIQEHIEWIYDKFTSHVAQGRNMSKEEVDKIGKGRVWSGRAARNKGLVDTLGGLKTAVEIAAQEAGIDKSFNEINLTILPSWSDYSLDLGFPLLASQTNSLQNLLPDQNTRSQVYFNTWLNNKDEKLHFMMPYWFMIK